MARRLLVMLAITCGTAGCPASPGMPGDMTEVAIDSVRDIGDVRNASLSDVLHEGGTAGRVGGKVLWAFGDTYRATPDGLALLVSSSGAYAEFASPTVLSEPLSSGGAPYQLLPFTDEEKSFNGAGADRYALRPTAVLPKGENAMILYAREKIHPGAAPVPVSTGFAEVEPWQTVAVRKGEVFSAPEPRFNTAAAFDAGDLYLYDCDASSRCKVARAAYDRVTERAAYSFWTGSTWSKSVGDAAAVVPGDPLGFSVSYNTYVERFVSFSGSGVTRALEMRVASRPEGPWGEPMLVQALPAGSAAATQHPELAEDAGRTLYVSYYLPTANPPGTLRLVEVKLR